jgi:serralysin
LFATQGGSATIKFNVSGLDADATGFYTITSSGGGSITGSFNGNGVIEVSAGDLQEGLLTATVTATDLEGFDAVGAGDTTNLDLAKVILLDNLGNTVGGFNTIDAAADAAGSNNNYTILLGEGTYTENVFGYSGSGLHIIAQDPQAVMTLVNIIGPSITVDAGEGDDTVLGTNNPDTINGHGGNDNLSGNGGADFLDGGADDDALLGGLGNDTMVGGTGNDFLSGGFGIDTALVAGTATFVATAGGWVVTSADGVDILQNVEIVDDDAVGNRILLVGGTGFATIQAAVNAAQNGDTILIAQGTYTEQVIVNGFTDLTIVAVDGAEVIVRAPNNVSQTATKSTGQGVEAIFTVTNSTNVTIDNLNIDGHGVGNTVTPGNDFIGIFYRNASGGLVDVDITGMRDPYPGGTTVGGNLNVSGIQRGVGVSADNDSLLDFAMSGGTIDDFQKNGGRFKGAILDIHDVHVTGGGAQTSIAQNGFVVENSTGSIDDNTIDGIGFAGAPGTYSGAILAFGNTDLEITDNTIVGANGETTAAQVVGIWIFDFGADSSGGEITGNDLSFVDTGVQVGGGPGNEADIQPIPIEIHDNVVTDLDLTDPFPTGVDFEPVHNAAVAYTVEGTNFQDYLTGAAAGDTFTGLGGNDEFQGYEGDDTLHGDAGLDQADYAGNFADYTITYETDGGGNVIGFATVQDDNAGDGDEGFDTLTSIEVLKFADVTLDLSQRVQLFNAGNVLVGTFDLIQDAIDAASDGFRIVALAGTFNENLTVDKDVTIEGANDGIAGTGARGPETIIDGGINVTADGVTIDGVTVLDAITGPGAPWPSGIYLDGDDFTLVNSVMNGAGAPTNGGGDNSAILTGTVTGLDVGNNLFQGYVIGMYISGGTTSGSVHDNRFQGVDGSTPSGLGNGINSETSHVVINNNVFDSLWAGVLNLFPFGPDPVDLNSYVSGNTFTNDFVRPIQIYPTADTQNVIGTNDNESFNADVSGVVGESFGFYGAGGADRAYGGDLADSFDGGTGDDQLYGLAGADSINGGAGADLLVGGLGDDTYYVDNNGDVITEASGEGRDSVYVLGSYVLTAGASVEVMSTTALGDTATINLVGNELNQEIYGNAGVNLLRGGGGTDFMVGFGGNDTYYVDSADDIAYEVAGQGTDIVYTSASYTLTAGTSIELLSTESIGGVGAIDLTGNELANTLWGNNGVNVLNGGLGADSLVGFGGADTFAFTTALGGGNVDKMADFTSGSDKVALDDAVFTAIGPLGALNANAFFAGTAAHDADDRIIYDSVSGRIWYDADGNGAGGQVLFATVDPATVLVASDFQVI